MVALSFTTGSVITGVIDFTALKGPRLFNRATYKLDEDPYDCQLDELY
jgi:hypothetical protein